MNLSDKAYREKRGFVRIRVDTMITFSIESSNERYEARCKDLSGAGMLIETGKKLSIGQKIQVTVPSEGPNFDNLQATVEVIRVDPQPEQHKFLIGVVICQITQ